MTELLPASVGGEYRRFASMDEYAAFGMASLEEGKRKVNGRAAIRPIKTVLVANNGIAAVKCMRSIREWAYGIFGRTDTVQFCCMATPEDISVNAEYIRMADQVEEVPGGSNLNNYANVDLIVEIAERRCVDAVWAGWGHASENPRLPQALDALDIVFLGPGSRAMADLGDKIGSTLIAQSAGVPCVEWSGSGITIDYAKDGIQEDVYARSCVSNVEEARAAIERVGYPAMIKASEGGGGKGIRKVEDPSQFEAAFRQVQGEVPGSPIFIMRMVRQSCHLEVQVLADGHGSAIALYGRDCSTQRRHQKIIEEGPAAIAPADVWAEMENAAISLAKAVGYCGAGTVEYLFDPSVNKFYFLELNPRLQVEHPVTELITGVNLPALQLQVGMGFPLTRIPMLRRFYGLEGFSQEIVQLDSDSVGESTILRSTSPFGPVPTNAPIAYRRKPLGHCIAARITGENPFEGFKPTSGYISELTFRSTPHVWGYFSVSAKGGLHEFADSQFGHVFAFGLSREYARRELVMALKELSIRGEISTPIAYVTHLLESDTFRNNGVTTEWLDGLIRDRQSWIANERALDKWVSVCAGALFRAQAISRARCDEFIAYVERGQVPPRELLLIEDNIELVYDDMKYSFLAQRSGVDSFLLTLRLEIQANNSENGHDEPERVSGGTVEAKVKSLGDGGLLMLLNEHSYVCYGDETVLGLRLVISGRTVQFETEYDPTKLRSDSAGKLVRFLVEDGATVSKGEAYAEVEVMKMYLPLVVGEAGVIRLQKQEGSILQAGDVLATLELLDPSTVRRATVCAERMPDFKSPLPLSQKAHMRLNDSLNHVQRVLQGYTAMVPRDDSTPMSLLERRETWLNSLAPVVISELFERLRDPLLPLHDVRDALSRATAKLPRKVLDAVTSSLDEYEQKITDKKIPEFPAKDIIGVLTAAVREDPLLGAVCDPLLDVCKKFRFGLQHHQEQVILSLLRTFVRTERSYPDWTSSTTKLNAAREAHEGKLTKLFQLELARYNRSKNAIVLALVDRIRADTMPSTLSANPTLALKSFVSVLHDLCELSVTPEIARKARYCLMRYQMPSFEQRMLLLESMLRDHARWLQLTRKDKDSDIVREPTALFDVLVGAFSHDDHELRIAALDAYVRRCYNAYEVDELRVSEMSPQEIDPNFHLEGAAATEFDENSLILRARWRYRIRSGARHRRHPSGNGVFNGSGGMKRSDSTTDFVSAMLRVRSDLSLVDAEQTALAQGRARDPCSPQKWQYGEMFVIPSYPHVSALLPGILAEARERSKEGGSESYRVIEFAVPARQRFSNSTEEAIQQDLSFREIDSRAIQRYGELLVQHSDALSSAGINRVTVAKLIRELQPRYYTFRDRLSWTEDAILRHVEPALSYHMELNRLIQSPYSIELCPTEHKQIHLYFGREKTPKLGSAAHTCFFARAIVRGGHTHAATLTDFLVSEAENILVKALESIELTMGSDPLKSNSWNNHIFMNFVPSVVFDPTNVEAIMKQLANKYRRQLVKLRVAVVEVVAKLIFKATPESSFTGDEKNPTTVRFITTNPTSFRYQIEAYVEATDGAKTVLMGNGPRDGADAIAPYALPSAIDFRRIAAHQTGTTYAYDFPTLFEVAARQQWKSTIAQRTASAAKGMAVQVPTLPQTVMHVRELVLTSSSGPAALGTATPSVIDPSVRLVEVERNVGQNDIGMVAWRITLFTPDFPAATGGRDIILIANDITTQIGSFGKEEDVLFCRASELARRLGVPRLYIAANSGARIGVANEVRNAFKVEWKKPEDPTQGFHHLYVEQPEMDKLTDSLIAESTADAVDRKYRITDIIGKEDGLGVENLRFSGLIAGETSRAYDEIFTLSIVTGRTVGIGSYLVRLGQRVIQNKGPIILTGAGALNQLLGRQVYANNAQLGGPHIMFNNGVSHLAVSDDLTAVKSAVDWLSYIPRRRGACVPITPRNELLDYATRKIGFVPARTPYDPRQMLSGCIAGEGEQQNVPPGAGADDGFADLESEDLEVAVSATSEPDVPHDLKWASGFFDRRSFVETLAGWGKTVVTGRARLGGVPVGVICVETRTVQHHRPADPADPSKSSSQTTSQAGQVWFPDSSYKTAQALADFAGEQLPCMLFANWRGFSGGLRDLFDEILKFGSYIVDNLRNYEFPVCVYIPPGGELRGGAWVVVDPTINADGHVEMFADSSARGGVLEPSGIIEIKYKLRDLIATMHRLDPELITLNADLAELKRRAADANDLSEMRAKISKREQLLLPVYRQIALHFADLHDTPGRMLAKGAISEVIEWRKARAYFCGHIKRRLLETYLCRWIRDLPDTHVRMSAEAKPNGMSHASALQVVYEWFKQDCLEELYGVAPVMPQSSVGSADQSSREPPTMQRRVGHLLQVATERLFGSWKSPRRTDSGDMSRADSRLSRATTSAQPIQTPVSQEREESISALWRDDACVANWLLTSAVVLPEDEDDARAPLRSDSESSLVSLSSGLVPAAEMEIPWRTRGDMPQQLFAHFAQRVRALRAQGVAEHVATFFSTPALEIVPQTATRDGSLLSSAADLEEALAMRGTATPPVFSDDELDASEEEQQAADARALAFALSQLLTPAQRDLLAKQLSTVATPARLRVGTGAARPLRIEHEEITSIDSSADMPSAAPSRAPSE